VSILSKEEQHRSSNMRQYAVAPATHELFFVVKMHAHPKIACRSFCCLFKLTDTVSRRANNSETVGQIIGQPLLGNQLAVITVRYLVLSKI
jgi:hypothetical protein